MSSLNRKMSDASMRILQMIIIFAFSAGGFFLVFFVAELADKKKEENTFVMKNAIFKEAIEESCNSFECDYIFVFEKDDAKYRFLGEDEEKSVLNKGTPYDITYNNKKKEIVKIDYPKSKQ